MPDRACRSILLAQTSWAQRYWAATDGIVTVFRGRRHSAALQSAWISPPLASGLRLRDPIYWSPAPPLPGWTPVREIQAAEYSDLIVAREARALAWWAVHHPGIPMPARFATGPQDSWVYNRDL